MTKIKKGYIFEGPDDQGYVLTRDVSVGEVIRPSDFKPYGGAPKPEAGNKMPYWLINQIREIK